MPGVPLGAGVLPKALQDSFSAHTLAIKSQSLNDSIPLLAFGPFIPLSNRRQAHETSWTHDD